MHLFIFIFVTAAIKLTPSCFVTTCRYPAEGTMGATMIYSIPGFHRPGASLCAPVGGTAAVVDKLGGCLEKFGGSMELKKHVEEIIVEDGEATGVVLKGGRIVRAKHAVVSNATVWDTVPLLPNREELTLQGLEGAADWKEDMAEIPALGSIMHLFLGEFIWIILVYTAIRMTRVFCLQASTRRGCRTWTRRTWRSMTGTDRWVTRKTSSPSSYPRCWTRRWRRLVSTSYTCTPRGRNRSTCGKVKIATARYVYPFISVRRMGNWKTDVSCFSFHRSIKITNASGRRFCGTQSSASSPTSNNALRWRSTPRR